MGASKSLLFIIGLIGLVIILFLGFYIGIQYQERITKERLENSTPTVTPKPTITPTPTPKPSPTPSPFPGGVTNNDESTVVFEWATYVNTKHKYTVTYPKTWSIDTSEADKEEDFTDGSCCNSAKLRLLNKHVLWEFVVNPSPVVNIGPKECKSSKVVCDFTNTPIKVMGLQLQRTIIRLKKPNKILEAYISTPGKGEGFGQVGITNQFTTPTQVKYTLNYYGDSMDKYMMILDTITENLQPTP